MTDHRDPCIDDDQPIVPGPHALGWSRLIDPYRVSIRARFHLALVLALGGLILMAGIAKTSDHVLLARFEEAAKEASEHMMPAHHLELSLRDAERLASLYLISGDRELHQRFRRAAAKVDRQFDAILRGLAPEHVTERSALLRAQTEWHTAFDRSLTGVWHPVEQSPVTETMMRFSADMASAYGAVSELHHTAMREIGAQVAGGQTVALWTGRITTMATVFGFFLLFTLIAIVRGSILQPIGKLQSAAIRLGKKDFSHRVRLSNMQDELGQLAGAFNSAAGSLQKMYRELKKRSTRDGLTGTLNRGAFEERLDAECRSADRHDRPLSLLMVDIDHFKRINDNYGHPTGDDVLRTLARLLDEATRPGDVVARYGGEEFVVILPESGETGAAAMAERLRDGVEAARFDGLTGLAVTVSIGHATRRPHSLTPDDLIEAADEALYRAKEGGRNRVVSASRLSLTDRLARRRTTAA